MNNKGEENYFKDDNSFFCQKNACLEKIQADYKGFLLIVLFLGKLSFWIDEKQIVAEAPCCICFDENKNRRFDTVLNAEYYCICFGSEFLFGNVTLDFLRKSVFLDIAQNHELILLEPFFKKRFSILKDEEDVAAMREILESLQEEMKKEKDMYWYFRCRSYFMEILFALERMYNISGQVTPLDAKIQYMLNDKLKAAVLYIEKNYQKKITLKDIAAECGINHTTLINLMNQEIGKTPMEYLNYYRIRVARKYLASSQKPIKEIAFNCGFKTTEHFSRVFKNETGKTPGEFREKRVEKKGKKIQIDNSFE